MSQNKVQVQKGFSLPAFIERYGTESQCEQALESARWRNGFACSKCGSVAHGTFRDGPRKVFQCRDCRHQTSLIAGTVFQGSKLPLTIWFLAIYLISQAKTGISSLALKRQLGVSYPTAWMMHHKLMQAMSDRESLYFLEGNIQIDDAYLGGERAGGKVGRGSENKVPFVAAVSLSEDNHPLRVRLSLISGFTRDALESWSLQNLMPGSTVYSDGLACFAGVSAASCKHFPTSMNGKKPRDVPEFKWINTVLGNLKTSFSGSLHAFNFRKYASRYFAAFCYRFNRRFDLSSIQDRLLVAAVNSKPKSLGEIRRAYDSF